MPAPPRHSLAQPLQSTRVPFDIPAVKARKEMSESLGNDPMPQLKPSSALWAQDSLGSHDKPGFVLRSGRVLSK